jgi:methionyl-tRNA synthetase
MEKYLVTSALPYANGPLHVGHLAGAYLPADIYVRFLRLTGKDVVFICGTDEHGVPITLAAEKLNIAPKDYVAENHNLIKEAFEKAGIFFDNFSGTARPVHYQIATQFFLTLNERGFLEKKAVKQLYCENCKRFLPDRYVEGACPKCGKPGARGDQCESCGSDLDQTELISPYCKICGKKPVLRDTFHWFLKLSAFAKQLEAWLGSKKGEWKDNVLHFCAGLLKEGLPDRAITRDMEWGIPVPLPEGAGKVIYVWFDAPIGYISSTVEWAAEIKKSPDLWKNYWLDPECRLIHFIGKDNIVFHSIMWPAMLMGVGGYVLPSQIPANEFLNIEGRKISTSRNHAIWVHEFLREFPADALRYYLAIISPETKDSDFVLSEFQAANNNELADILGNFINRTITFVHRYYDGKVPQAAPGHAALAEVTGKIGQCRKEMEAAFASYQVRKACQLFMNLCRDSNKFFNDRAPWKARKDSPGECAATLNACLLLIKAISVLSQPVIPFAAEKIRRIFPASDAIGWENLASPLSPGASLGQLDILFTKIEDETIQPWKGRLQG